MLSLLRAALEDNRFSRDVEAAAVGQQAAENEALGFDNANRGGIKTANPKGRRRRGPCGLPTAAARIRAMHHRSRVADEKRWVALDAVLNPHLYHHVTLGDAEEMRWDTLYYTRLDREDITRLLSLPVLVQLALPFLHTPDEVAAHELLGRYTLGLSADHFSRLDSTSQDVYVAGGGSGESGSQAKLDLESTVGGSGTRETDNVEEVKPVDGGDYFTGGAEESDGVTTSPRVLACMRRVVQAQLKILPERSRDEAVWLALDKRLRPEFYEETDEAAGDRDDENHREADAKEDARHAWLRRKGDGERIIEASTLVAIKEKRSSGATSHAASVSDTPSGAEHYEDCGELGTADGAMKREALAKMIADAFDDENDLRGLTAAVLGYDHASGCKRTPQSSEGTRQEIAGMVSNDTEIFMDESQRPTGYFSGGTISGGSENDHRARRANLERDQRKDERLSVGSDVHVKISSEHISEALMKNDAASNENNQGNELPISNERDENRATQEPGKLPKMDPHRLEEIAKAVLARFLVREEETPLGRDMTHSLAILQEATLRLGRGEVGVMRGLSQRSAIAALYASRSSAGDTTAPAAAALTTVRTGSQEARTLRAATSSTQAEVGHVTETAGNGSGDPEPEHMTNRENDDDSNKIVARAGKASVGGTETLSFDNNNARDDGDNDVHKHFRALNTFQDHTVVQNQDGICLVETAGEDERSILGTVRSNQKLSFGSWEEVHPASLGAGSQEVDWAAGGSTSVEERVHPASFRVSTSTAGTCRGNLPETCTIAASN